MNTLLLKRPQIALTYSRRQATFNETENAAMKRRFASQINYEWSITNDEWGNTNLNYEWSMTNDEISLQHIVHSAFDVLRHRHAIIKFSNLQIILHQHTSTSLTQPSMN